MADPPATPRRVVPRARVLGRGRGSSAAIEVGSAIRRARERRKWTQAQLGTRVGITQTRQSQIELGDAGVPLEVLYAEAEALGLTLRLNVSRDPIEDLADAGHLAIQELVLRLARLAGRGRSFELPTRPSDPSLSVDVFVRDDLHRVLQINECWNTISNFGAAVRSTRRKIAEAEQLAVSIGGDRGAYRVAACWIVRGTRRNRELLARYPDTFAATFTGSSALWVKALTDATSESPSGLGIVLTDVDVTRLIPWRSR